MYRIYKGLRMRRMDPGLYHTREVTGSNPVSPSFVTSAESGRCVRAGQSRQRARAGMDVPLTGVGWQAEEAAALDDREAVGRVLVNIIDPLPNVADQVAHAERGFITRDQPDGRRPAYAVSSAAVRGCTARSRAARLRGGAIRQTRAVLPLAFGWWCPIWAGTDPRFRLAQRMADIAFGRMNTGRNVGLANRDSFDASNTCSSFETVSKPSQPQLRPLESSNGLRRY